MADIVADGIVYEFRADIRDLQAAVNRIDGALVDAGRQAAKTSATMSAAFSSLQSRLAGLEGRIVAFGKSMAIAILAPLAGGAVAGAVVRTIVEFEKLRASLETVTGSADAARDAFDLIKDFASSTPFSVQEATEAFIKLKGLGLDPSIEAMRSYGNTASAMGKSLSQMIEAVADAATGEFERLKEFGIRASSQGDKVTFTFRGVSTTVTKSAAEIEGYLRRIGDVEFAGGMERQAKTLGGALSNLGDAVDSFVDALGEGGLSSAIADVTRKTSDWLSANHDVARSLGDLIGREIRAISNDLATLAKSYELFQQGRYLDAIGFAWAGTREEGLMNMRFGRGTPFGEGDADAFYDATGFRAPARVTVTAGRRGAAAGSGAGSGRGSSDGADEWRTELRRIRDRIAALDLERVSLGLSTEEQEKARVALELYNAARDAGLKIGPEIRAQIEAQSTAYAAAAAALERAKAAQEAANEAVRGFADLSYDVIEGLVTRTRTFGETLDSVTQSLIRMVLQAALLGEGPLGKLFAGGGAGGGILGSVFSSFFGGAGGALGTSGGTGGVLGGLYHTGGTVGAGAAGRFLSADIWANAPRFHGGGVIGPDERAIIGRVGETVLTPAQMAAMSRSRTEVVINAPPGSEVRETRTESVNLERVVIDIIGRAEARGNFDNVRNARYGIGPQKKRY